MTQKQHSKRWFPALTNVLRSHRFVEWRRNIVRLLEVTCWRKNDLHHFGDMPVANSQFRWF